MILDSQTQFSAAQDLAAAAIGDTVSSNVLDTGAAQDEGIGEPMHLFVNTDLAVTSAGAATVQFVIQTSADNATWTDAAMTDAVAKAALVAGYQRYLKLPIGLQRYIRVVYRVGVAALTTGKFTAAMTKDIQKNVAYGSGFSVA